MRWGVEFPKPSFWPIFPPNSDGRASKWGKEELPLKAWKCQVEGLEIRSQDEPKPIFSGQTTNPKWYFSKGIPPKCPKHSGLGIILVILETLFAGFECNKYKCGPWITQHPCCWGNTFHFFLHKRHLIHILLDI